MKKTIDDKVILITGGTGSFGKNFIKHILQNFRPKKVIVFSRDELKQFQMQKEIDDKRLRFFIGDIRDLQRLRRAFRGVDVIVHAAALKQVPALEYNPFEAVKTNTIGSQNVIEAAIDEQVKKVLLISTDKAAQPINLYGATKLAAEKLFVSGNSYGKGDTIFSVVRYGNVIGSRGSIIEQLIRQEKATKVSITHPDMTRFWITLDQSFQLVLFALEKMEGGEIFIPKIPSMKLSDLFDAVVPLIKREITGVRPGEKMHEILLTDQESRHALELEKYYVILPEFHFFSNNVYSKYYKNGKPLPNGFCFSSDTNEEWLSKDQFKKILLNVQKIMPAS